jgi:protein-S-isoprenylcysteine O-methyltransferase Ste14/uncharacterized membrane protein (UPF0127 family)
VTGVALDAATGSVIADRLRVADTHWTRLRGLLGTDGLAPGAGLWITPCRQVHMFGMRYAIDVVFLDRDSRIVALVSELAPWRVSPSVKHAASVIELPAGTIARLGLRAGAALAIERPSAVLASGLRFDSIAAYTTNLFLAALWLFFAAAHWTAARTTGQWASTMPIVVQELLLVGLFLTRRRSHATSDRPLDWAVGMAGTFLPMVLRPGATPSAFSAIGSTIELVGLLLGTIAIASLGRSIGVVPANRGVKVSGAYRLVRHPIYAAHITTYLGYVIAYPTARNLTIVGATLVALVVRAKAEEHLLAGEETYAAYLARVRWRIIPYVY